MPGGGSLQKRLAQALGYIQSHEARWAEQPHSPGPSGALQSDAATRIENELLRRQIAEQADRLREVTEQKRKATAEVTALRRKVVALSVENAKIHDTFSFRLGAALVRALTLQGLLNLPRDLWALWKDPRRLRRRHERQTTQSQELVAERSRVISEALEEASNDAPEEVTAKLRTLFLSPAAIAQLLADMAKSFRGADLPRAIAFGREALRLDASAPLMRLLAGLTYDAGMIEEPAVLLDQAEALQPLPPNIAVRAGVVRGLLRIRREGLELPPRLAAPAYAAQSDKVMYLAASSLPHHVSGYTIRTQNVIAALRDSGWDVEALTRVGYPWDRRDSRQVDGQRERYEVAPVIYRRLAGSSSTETPFHAYCEEAAGVLMREMARGRHGLIHAASNYVNALPALIAARRLGIPFVYEVRGLWELTSVSKGLGGEDSERFGLMRDLESLVAREADAVMALTQGLKEELVLRGVEADRITLTPNCVDVDHYTPMPRDTALASQLGLAGRFTIGFIGSHVGYEGLEDLVDAIAGLAALGHDPALLLVGDGPSAAAVQQHAIECGIADRLIAVGRVPPEQVPAYYSLIDVAAFPRRPERVCEIVSPLKPLEAQAMGKPVVASSVAALAEMVNPGVDGLVFDKGDIQALTAALNTLITQPDLVRTMGANGRRFVEANRTWSSLATAVGGVYKGQGLAMEPAIGGSEPA